MLHYTCYWVLVGFLHELLCPSPNERLILLTSTGKCASVFIHTLNFCARHHMFSQHTLTPPFLPRPTTDSTTNKVREVTFKTLHKVLCFYLFFILCKKQKKQSYKIKDKYWHSALFMAMHMKQYLGCLFIVVTVIFSWLTFKTF